ncbi:hypothetical protein MBLNU13_g08304t1 [Cladosporium sp. NU13]
MSGFEVVAAALGVAELTVASISRVHEFIAYIKNAPDLVVRLRLELCELKDCLSELATISAIGSPAQPVVQRLGIPERVTKCGDTCLSLENSLKNWTESGPETLASRLRMRINKSHIESAIQEITSTKDKIHFAVAITTLLQSNMAERSSTQLRESSRRSPSELLEACSADAAQSAGQLVVRQTEQPDASVEGTKPVRTSVADANPRSVNCEREEWMGSQMPEEGVKVRRVRVQQTEATGSQHADDNDVEDCDTINIGGGLAMPTTKTHTASRNKVKGSKNTNIGHYNISNK